WLRFSPSPNVTHWSDRYEKKTHPQTSCGSLLFTAPSLSSEPQITSLPHFSDAGCKPRNAKPIS
ncbi:hypothetical protein MTX35_25295, partial [Rhodococcus sp. ARC_M12]